MYKKFFYKIIININNKNFLHKHNFKIYLNFREKYNNYYVNKKLFDIIYFKKNL